MHDRPDMSDIPRAYPDLVAGVEAAVAERRGILIMKGADVGATMLARRIPTILPDLDAHKRRWLAIEYGALGMGRRDNPVPPFRAPHHSVSATALVGSTVGPIGRAGEAQLARFGVLYLDDVVELRTGELEALHWTLRRMGDTAPLVVASAWHCYCRQTHCQGDARGYHTSEVGRVHYQRRLAHVAALLGLTTIEAPAVTLAALRTAYTDGNRVEPSEAIRGRIAAAWGVA